MGARTVAAILLCVLGAGVLAVEVASWAQSARFGPISATTFRCTVRLDTLSDSDRGAGLQNGDILQLPAMDVRSRVPEVFHYTPTQAGHAGERITLAVLRNGKQIFIPYTLRHLDPGTTLAAQLAFKLIMFAIAAVLLFRGSDRASLLLGFWCMGVGLGLPDAWWGMLPLAGRITGGALTAVLWTCLPYVLYLVVEALAKGVSNAEKIIARASMAILILPSLLINAVNATSQALNGCALVDVSPWITSAAFAASQVVIIAFFALSYVRTSGLDKQRIRWVFWSFLISRAGVLANLLNRLLAHPLHLSGLEWFTVLVFPIGCAYAILKHRIIDVNFVLNRTLVFTLLTSFIVGLFILLEDVLGKVAVGHGVGLAVETIVALAIGFSFNAMHKRLEEVIARALFRTKFEAVNALRRLAEEAPYMESAEALLARAAQEVRKATRAAATAIYEGSANGYRLSASDGDVDAPPELPIDDLAFVRMRKSRAAVDLSDVASGLGSDGLAFPLTVRGVLTGALLCRRRPDGEAYAPDERDLLASVAHELGAELNAIRARRQSELLNAVLAGYLDVRTARSQLDAT